MKPKEQSPGIGSLGTQTTRTLYRMFKAVFVGYK